MIIAAVTIALFATDPTIGDHVVTEGEFEGSVRIIRETLDRDLFDFETARFKDVSVTAASSGDRRSVLFCGEINARNRDGGYAGWQIVRGGVTWRVGEAWPTRAAVVYSRRDDIAIPSRDSEAQQQIDMTLGTMACSAAAIEAGDGAPMQTERLTP